MPQLRDLLEDPNPALSALAERPAGLFVDFDGTISRLAPTPDEAIASPRVVRSLERLSGKLAVVCVLSGRRARTSGTRSASASSCTSATTGRRASTGMRTPYRPLPSSTATQSRAC